MYTRILAILLCSSKLETSFLKIEDQVTDFAALKLINMVLLPQYFVCISNEEWTKTAHMCLLV